jgi:pyruvate dehydrogenase (quinone)
VFALLGDGAMQMNGVNELITVAKYWREWTDPRFALRVLNNRDLSFVSWEQRSGEGTPKFDDSQLLPDVDYAAWARSLGLGGVRVDDPGQVGPAWEAALAADRPTVIDAVVDPSELMIPPQFTFEEARKTAESIVRGDTDWRGILRRGLPTAAATLLPHRH